jgi:threonine dehydrogenase-like Zn-dependent dehydrogenase
VPRIGPVICGAIRGIDGSRLAAHAGRLELAFLVTHRFPLADWAQALEALRGPDSPRGKVLLTMG